MSSQLIESHKEKAQIYHGEDVCKQKFHQLLESFSLPNNLFPIEITELGYEQSSGFIWLKQKKKTVQKNALINKTASFDSEITAFIEKGRLRNVTGLKGKAILIWVPVTDILIRNPSSGDIEFAIPSGRCISLPLSAFDLKEAKDDSLKNRKQ